MAIPVITSISPNTDVNTGGSLITINGTGFNINPAVTGSVKFGNVSLTPSQIVSRSATKIEVLSPATGEVGVVDVQINNTGPGYETSSNTANTKFTVVYNLPVILNVTPTLIQSSDSIAPVQITGGPFYSDTTVLIGGINAPVVSYTQTLISANYSSSLIGTGQVDVTINNSGGKSATKTNAINFPAPTPQPTINTITPHRGPTTGGTAVTITGSNLYYLNNLFIGDKQIGFTVTDGPGTTLTATTPSNSAGLHPIRFTVAGQIGFPQNSGINFEYFTPPSISNIYPKKGEIGTEVIIEGSNFANDCIIKFNGVNANTTVVSNTQIKCIIPTGMPFGLINLTLESASTSGLSISNAFKVTNQVYPVNAIFNTTTNNSIYDKYRLFNKGNLSQFAPSQTISPYGFRKIVSSSDGNNVYMMFDTGTNPNKRIKISKFDIENETEDILLDQALSSTNSTLEYYQLSTTVGPYQYNIQLSNDETHLFTNSRFKIYKIDVSTGISEEFVLRYSTGNEIPDIKTIKEIITHPTKNEIAVCFNREMEFTQQVGDEYWVTIFHVGYIGIFNTETGRSISSSLHIGGGTNNSIYQDYPISQRFMTRGMCWTNQDNILCSVKDLSTTPDVFRIYEVNRTSGATSTKTTPQVSYYQDIMLNEHSLTHEGEIISLLAPSSGIDKFKINNVDKNPYSPYSSYIDSKSTIGRMGAYDPKLKFIYSGSVVYDLTNNQLYNKPYNNEDQKYDYHISDIVPLNLEHITPTFSSTTLWSYANPREGSINGGTEVEIRGEGFDGNATVEFGGIVASQVIVISPTFIKAITPPHSQGLVDIKVTNPDSGLSVSKSNGFAYLGALNITSITPNYGPNEGGTLVTVTGSGFTGSTGTTKTTIIVEKGGAVPPNKITVISPTELRFYMPPSYYESGSRYEGLTNIDYSGSDIYGNYQAITKYNSFTYVDGESELPSSIPSSSSQPSIPSIPEGECYMPPLVNVSDITESDAKIRVPLLPSGWGVILCSSEDGELSTGVEISNTYSTSNEEFYLSEIQFEVQPDTQYYLYWKPIKI